MKVDPKIKLQELANREIEIPKLISDGEKNIEKLQKVYEDKETERRKALQNFNDAKKERNRAFRDKAKVRREINELRRELWDIPRKKKYYQRKIQKAQPKPVQPKSQKPTKKGEQGAEMLGDVIDKL